MRLVSLVIIFGFAAAAQTPKPAGGDAQATFSTTTQLVIETVNVKDKSGKSIDNLTAKDFTITEDGVPQTIRFFELQQLPDVPNTSTIQPAPAQRPEPFKRLTRTQI